MRVNGARPAGALLLTVALSAWAGALALPGPCRAQDGLDASVITLARDDASDAQLMQEGDAMVKTGQNEEAVARYRALAERFPNSSLHTEALWKLGELLARLGRVAEARPVLYDASLGRPAAIARRAEHLLNQLPKSGGRELAAPTAEPAPATSAPPAQAGLAGPPAPFQRTLAAPTLTPSQATWQNKVVAYCNAASPESTAAFVNTLAGQPLEQEQERILLQLLALLSEARLKELAALQPSRSPLAPYLHLTQGDLAMRGGDEGEARRLWTQAGGSQQGMVPSEANQRLNGADPEGAPGRVGLLLPLSDKHEALGRNLIQAAQKALNDHRDVPLVLVVADSGDQPELSREAAERLALAKVEAVVGPLFHASAKAAAVVIDRHNIPIITLNPHADVAANARGVVLLNAYHPDEQARVMARHAIKAEDRRNAAILAPDTDYGRLTGNAFAEEFRRQGGSAAPPVFFPPDETDFSPWIKSLGRPDTAKGKGGFDALFLPATAEQARLIAPQAAHYDILQPHVLLLGTALWNRKELLTSGTEYLKGARFCDTEELARENFRQGYRKAWQEEPTSFAYLVYDSVAAVAQSMRDQRQGGPDWRQGLTRFNGFGGSAGPFRFAPHGPSVRNYQLFTVKENGFSPIWTERITAIQP